MLLLNLLLAQSLSTLTLDLGSPGIPVSPTLYGLMTEEINYSYDGGLYGELVRNRAFKDNTTRTPHWTAVGDNATLELDKTTGPTDALPVSLKVSGGVANDGYWGFPIRRSEKYRLSIWAKADKAGPIVASLESNDGSKVYAKAEIDGVGTSWHSFKANFKTASDVQPTKDARLVLRTGTDRTTWLGFVSLFPPTYGGRWNGNRPELMQLLVDMKPRFLRFPGGNYLEGGTIAERFPWKQTLGPLEERPGHMSPWGYRSTDGMGLLEFLEWAEDMKAKPVLAIFAGYSLGGQVVKAGPELEPYIQEGLDEIEYLIGGPNTKWGAMRIKNGHKKPFPLECVEVGNEDGFDRSGSYEGRFAQFYDAIKAKYPQLQVIATTGGKDWLGVKYPITTRKPDMVDEHYYASTTDMLEMATKFDSYDRKGPKVFVGEWASQDVPEPWTNASKKGPTPNLRSALADSAFMTGLERNTDIVKMACYAPLLVNVNPGGRQWAINLIGYDALNVFGSPSYYAQRMFSENLGDQTVPLSFSTTATQTRAGKVLPCLFVSATRDKKTGQLFLKVVNAGPTDQEVAINFAGGKVSQTGTSIVLGGDPAAMNDLVHPKGIAPVSSTLHGLGESFHRTFAANSITVLKLSTR